jgi:hypothetical protein
VSLDGTVCGDLTMSLSLAPGTYTLLISDAAYIPNAAFDNGTLGEGFTDLTGGAFQTCNFDASGGYACQNDTANWAVDLTVGSGTVTTTPEPGAPWLLLIGFAALIATGKLTR